MSANLLVDLGNTAYSQNSFISTGFFAASGALPGAIIADMLHADTFTNLIVFGTLTGSAPNSGQLRIGVQTSDTTNSGDFTDPTSGLSQFPTVFQSGGFIFINSGSVGSPAAGQTGVLGAFTSGQACQSGFIVFAGFQRPHRYARTFIPAPGSFDFFQGPLGGGFVAQLKTTGSGGGFTLAPSSGVVNV